MPAYEVDTLHPDQLVCQDCGQAVAELPLDTPAPDGSLTVRQAIDAWPDLDLVIRHHDVVCTFQQMKATGQGWYVHLLPRLKESGRNSYGG